MYSFGMTTIFMYLASLTSFLLGVQFANFFVFGVAIGTLLFVAATAILLTMMGKRAERQDF